MPTYKLAYNPTENKALILKEDGLVPVGSTDAGTFEHGEGEEVGEVPIPALFHHVQDLLQKLGVDMAEVTIDYLSDHTIVTGLILNFTDAVLEDGDTKQIVATLIPTNASTQELIYSSDDESKVTVSGTGLIAAQATNKPFCTTVTVTTKDGGFTSKIRVIVL